MILIKEFHSRILQRHRFRQDGICNIIDDKDPIPSISLHPKQVKLFEDEDDKLDFKVTFKISSVSEIPMEKLECRYHNHETSEFNQACYEGNEAKVDRLLKVKDLDLKTFAECEMNGFMIACRKGFTEIVSLVLKYVAKMNNRENRDKLLDINGLGGRGMNLSGLTMAILEGHIEIVKMITQQEAFQVDLNSVEGEDGHSPFMYACKKGMKDIVKYLLQLAEFKTKEKFDLNRTDSYGNTAFHLACLNKKEDIVDLIIRSADKLKIELDFKE